MFASFHNVHWKSEFCASKLRYFELIWKNEKRSRKGFPKSESDSCLALFRDSGNVQRWIQAETALKFSESSFWVAIHTLLGSVWKFFKFPRAMFTGAAKKDVEVTIRPYELLFFMVFSYLNSRAIGKCNSL